MLRPIRAGAIMSFTGSTGFAVQQRVNFETKNRPYEIKGLRVS
jgi:hypothetical protein